MHTLELAIDSRTLQFSCVCAPSFFLSSVSYLISLNMTRFPVRRYEARSEVEVEVFIGKVSSPHLFGLSLELDDLHEKKPFKILDLTQFFDDVFHWTIF